MDEKRFANQVMHGKHFNYLCLAILIIILILIVSIFVVYKTAHSSILNKELSPTVTIESADKALLGEDILAKFGNAYYEVDSNENLLGLLRLDEWTQSDEFSNDGLLLILHFGEEYEMYFYDNEKVLFYDGYAAKGTKSEAYYEVPADIVDNISQYITANGTERELGDGKIAMSTFLK